MINAPVRIQRWILVAVPLLAFGPVSCQPPAGGETPSPSAATQPAATQPAPLPELPKAALLSLAELEPNIARPVNPAGVAEVREEAKASVAEGERFLNAKDYSAAVGPLERAIGYEPANARVRRLLGLAYKGLGDRGRAEENLRKAVEKAPDDLESHVLLADLQVTDQKPEEAIRSLRTALLCTGADANEPMAAEALLRLGGLLEKQGYFTAAAECYGRLSEWMDRQPARYAERPLLRQLVLTPERLLARRGAVLLAARKPTEALEFLQGAFKRDRTDAATARMLVQCLLDMKDYPTAEKVLLDMMPEPLLKRQLPALAEEAARASGDTGLPARLWRAAPKKVQGDAVLAISLAQACQRLGANDAALEILQSVFQSMPENVTMARELAELAAKAGKPEKGLAILVVTLAASESAEPAVVGGLRGLVASLPPGIEERMAATTAAQEPNDVFAYHYVVGRIAQLRHNLSLAAAQYQKAIDARKEFQPAREALLDILLEQKQFVQAREQLDALEKLNLEPHFVLYLRGRVELAQGKLDAATDVLEKSLAANDKYVPTLLLLAEAEQRKGLTRQAISRLLSALRLPGDRVEVSHHLLPLLLAEHQERQAEALVESLRRDQPDSVDVGLLLGEFQLGTGKFDEAAKTVADLTRKAPDNPDVALLAVRADVLPIRGVLSKADLQKTRQRLEGILKQDPKAARPRRMLAEVEELATQYAQAADTWKALADESPQDKELARQVARALILAKQYPQALEAVERVLLLDGNDAFGRASVVAVLERLKRFDQAIQRVEGWLAKAPGAGEKTALRRVLLRLCEDGNDFPRAVKVLDDVIKTVDDPNRRTRDPNFALGLKQARITVLVMAGQEAEALKAAREWKARRPSDQGGRQGVLAGLNRQRKYDRSLQLLDEWIGAGADPNLDSLRAMKLMTLGDANRIPEAISFAVQWAAASPEPIVPRILLVSVLRKAERYDDAVRLLDEWASQAPTSQPATAPTQPATAPAPSREANFVALYRIEACEMLRFKQDFAQALRRVDALLQQDPNNANLLNLKSTCLSEMGNKKDSIQCLEQVHSLRPFNPGAMNNLGYCYADLGIKLPDAERMIKQSVAVQPVLSTLDSLGWVLYKKGQFHEAAAVFESSILREEEAIASRSGDEEDRYISAVILDHAGDVFWRLGWSDRAIEFWSQALESAQKEKPLNYEAREVQAKVPAKIKAARAGQTPLVAPLGEGVKE